MVDWLPFVAMVADVLCGVGLLIVNKSVFTSGTNRYVLAVYSNAVAALIYLAASYRSRGMSSKLSLKIISWIFLLAIFGSTSQLCGYAGLEYSSPNLSTAVTNLAPAITFILAVIFRMEAIQWQKASTLAKVVGTIVSFSGALIVTFYQGPKILSTMHAVQNHFLTSRDELVSFKSTWVLGAFLFLLETILGSLWYILQTAIIKMYPKMPVVLFILMSFNTALSALYALVAEKDIDQWTLRFDKELLAIIYGAFFGLVLRIWLATWCLKRRGPLYVSMFKPTNIIASVVLGIIFLSDPLYLGSLIGSIVIVTGFCGVMWGKAQEAKTLVKIGQVESIESASGRTPLLQNEG